MAHNLINEISGTGNYNKLANCLFGSKIRIKYIFAWIVQLLVFNTRDEPDDSVLSLKHVVLRENIIQEIMSKRNEWEWDAEV